MTVAALEQQLVLIEQQFAQIAAALDREDAQALSLGSDTLRQLAIDLLHIMKTLPTLGVHAINFKQRVAILVQRLSDLRAHMARRAVHVDRAISLLIPAADPASYTDTKNPYGTVVRRSGQFNVISG